MSEVYEREIPKLDDDQLKMLAEIYTHPPSGVNCQFVMIMCWDLWRMGLLKRVDLRPDRHTVISSLALTEHGLRTLDSYL